MEDAEPDATSFEPMEAHKDVWSQQDLLKTILERHFLVHGSIGGTVLPAWNVSVKAEEDAHEQLLRLNEHLAKLG